MHEHVREQPVPLSTVGDEKGKEIVIYNPFERLRTLSHIADSINVEPWLVLGDFNAVADMSEVCGASGDIQSVIEDFQGFLIDTDRWPSAFYASLMPCTSDHSPLILKENALDNHRAKIQWLNGGDQCTRVFFRKVASRRASKRIFQITNDDGQTRTTPGEIIREFVGFYRSLLGGEPSTQFINLMYLRPWANHIVTVEESQKLLKPVTKEDIKLAIFDIAEDKSPGPDGYSSGFYKVAWSVIGEEVTREIMEFFFTGHLLRQLNATLLALIPKRIREVLDKIISPSQNAFVPGRSIADNIYQHRSYSQATIKNTCLGGARGLRQGDPMSPYLFVLVIEVLRMLLQQLIDQDRDFIFHWSPSSSISGLPLIASRFSFSDCKPLLLKIDSRIRGWGGLQLSFAARVQLIKSILKSLNIYWAMAFILPKGVIQEIEKWLRSFLWKGVLGDGYPKVAWNQVCRPIEEGGQRIRDILAINLALMSRHLWKIIQETVTPSGLTEFIMFNCKASQFGQSMIARDLGVGVSFYVMCYALGHLSSSAKAKLEKVISIRQWNWPLIPDIECLDIIYFVPTIHGGDDRISWRVEGGQFSNQVAYALFHPPGPKLGRSLPLLGPLKIPRNNFILWLAILGKLSTLDKHWLNQLDGTCILCSNGQPETHAHLFFSCPYSHMCINVIRQHVRFPLQHHD
ncbi:UNVERIFIED_CONTAM: hypothetical protein Slati_2397000 [Sesamum latifolium]|uniref:Reverse transcriptase zinc-binding domain-containing protein n=1 Tax=Sesamum latifolium TaxID=2727402 RepID=A0AAW2WG43_9LAMI